MKHWTENDFIDWTYELKTDTAHLDECRQCADKAQSVRNRRSEMRRQPEVSWEFLAAQRRSVYSRLHETVRSVVLVRWSASAATLLIVAAVSFGLLHERPPATPPSVADAQLYSELANIDQSNEPRAIKPIESMFEQ